MIQLNISDRQVRRLAALLGYACLLEIAIPDCFSDPGISGLKNANPGIPGLNPGIESLILN